MTVITTKTATYYIIWLNGLHAQNLPDLNFVFTSGNFHQVSAGSSCCSTYLVALETFGQRTTLPCIHFDGTTPSSSVFPSSQTARHHDIILKHLEQPTSGKISLIHFCKMWQVTTKPTVLHNFKNCKRHVIWLQSVLNSMNQIQLRLIFIEIYVFDILHVQF